MLTITIIILQRVHLAKKKIETLITCQVFIFPVMNTLSFQICFPESFC